MKISWLRPSGKNETQVVSPKNLDNKLNKLSTSSRESTKPLLNISFEKAVEIFRKLDFSLIHNDVRKILTKEWFQWPQLLGSLESLQFVDQFFNSRVNSLFIQQIDQIFSREENSYQIKTLLLTIDYFMNIQTLLLFLYWKILQSQYLIGLIEQIITQLIKIRYICLNNDYQIVQLMHLLFDHKIKIVKLKQYQIIQQPLLGHEILDLMTIDPSILGDAITEINEEFYSQLMFNNILAKIEDQKQTEFMKEYFNRVNSFSLYVQMTVLTKKDRKKAIDYFYEVCLKLCDNEDGEGVFILYTLSVERLDQELLKSIQYLSPDQQSNLIDMAQSFVCNKQLHTPNSTKKLYPIPSFYYYWTNLKKLEIAMQQTKDLKYLDSIRKLLVDLMFVRESNYARLKVRHKQSDSFLKYFLLKGHQIELQNTLQLPHGDWNRMQLKLMRMA